MNIAYWGNFEPPHSTENEIARALDALGHRVGMCQEGSGMVPILDGTDVVLWTRTADLSKRTPHKVQRDFLIEARRRGVPTVAVHLDRWWGLTANGREDGVWTEPFFRCEHFFSTDGAHDTEWSVAGVNHHWMPPAVSEFECVPGTPRDEYRSDIGFIGSTRGYHPEHPHRQELVAWLRETYGDRVRFWPEPGKPAVRRDDLRDLIDSVKVWVGDSCLAPRVDGGPMVRYWSDRVPEITGRGGALIHPYVEGIKDEYPELLTWEMGDWSDLKNCIDYYLADPVASGMAAMSCQKRTLEAHTYTVRMAQVLEVVCPS